jgi:hypothetical protein
VTNFLDEIFSAKTPEVPYAWTFTDVNPTNGLPSVHFATGVLTFTDRPISHEYLLGPGRYVDSQVKVWGAEGIHANPSSFVPPGAPVGWVDQLMILPSSSGYMVLYGKRANFGVQVSSYMPEVSTGSGFPGFPNARTGVLTHQIWLGVSTIILTLPESFSGLQGYGGSTAPTA